MSQRIQKGIAALVVLLAVAVGASAIAGAASNNGTTGNQGSSTNGTGQMGTANTAPPPAPSAASHGPGETLLTDGDATKVRQAALDKVPGATVLRVETDAQGSAYETHLRKPDGTEVTVKVDKQFNATDVENGFGPGGPPPGNGP